ncbi:MAG TPA: alpha/beta hydrolase, partial [bacterium]|nr:alpha/beta hydrolase [bacterium]
YISSTSAVDISGYVFVAPHLGFRSNTARENNPHAFAEVNTTAFVINGITQGLLFGHKRAVRFNYPAELLESDSGLVGYNTVNMANALTPAAPDEQLARITESLGVWIGEKDELLAPGKVASFVKNSNSSAQIETVAGEQHLSILLKAADLIGPWIQSHIGK